MNIPNEYVGLNIVENYINDCQNQADSIWLLNQARIKRPGRIHFTICKSLVLNGNLSMAMGRRLESFDLALRQSKVLQ